MLNQTRIGIGSITLYRRGHMKGQLYVFLISKSRNVYTFLLSVNILGNSGCHFLDMIMLITSY